jgi:hypothetical protein
MTEISRDVAEAAGKRPQPGPADATGLAHRRWPWAVAGGLGLVFLLAHLPFLPSSLEDIDSFNFALGVIKFNPALHQPHPPGYPIYILLGKIAALFLPLPKALALWGVLAGALAVLPLLQLFRCVAAADAPRFDEDRTSWWRLLAAVGLTLAAPLYWFTADRPLSDMTGLAAALLAQALLATAFVQQGIARRSATTPSQPGARALIAARSGRLIVLGAFAAAVSIGVRSQVAWLTLPLLALVLLDRAGRGAAGALLGSSMSFLIGGLLWGVPLLALSGGPEAYLAALGNQAGEDFSGVDMLATHLTRAHLSVDLLHTFVWPWSTWWLAALIIVLAVIGVIGMLVMARRGLLLLASVALPYAILHLLFHETVTTRYALPLVPIVAFLAVRGLDTITRRAAPVLVALVVAVSLALGGYAVQVYADAACPVVSVLNDMQNQAATMTPRPVLGMHRLLFAQARRAVAWAEAARPGLWTELPSRHGDEWQELLKYWGQGGLAHAWFLMDPERADMAPDLAAIDPASRTERGRYRWPVPERTLVGGMRPGELDWVQLSPPGWLLDKGWSLTPEMAGETERDHDGPTLVPITARVRRRAGAVRVMVGGRNLGKDTDPDVRFDLAIDGRLITSWTVPARPGFFLRNWDLPPGALDGPDRFAQLSLQARPANGSVRPVPAAIEQFDLQDLGQLMYGFGQGWYEQEFDPAKGARWRWTSDRAALRVVQAPARDLVLHLVGESPFRFYETPPTVTISAGSQELWRAEARGSFDWTVRVPAAALAKADGVITVETSQTLVPADRWSSNPDRRHLGLRVYQVDLKPAS